MTTFCRFFNFNAENLSDKNLEPIHVDSISINNAIFWCNLIPVEGIVIMFRKNKLALPLLGKVNVEYIKSTSNIC